MYFGVTKVLGNPAGEMRATWAKPLPNGSMQRITGYQTRVEDE